MGAGGLEVAMLGRSTAPNTGAAVFLPIEDNPSWVVSLLPLPQWGVWGTP